MGNIVVGWKASYASLSNSKSSGTTYLPDMLKTSIEAQYYNQPEAFALIWVGLRLLLTLVVKLT